MTDIAHHVVHTTLPKLGQALGAAGASMIGVPELSIMAAKGGEYLGHKAANAFTEITGVGLKPRYLGMKRYGRYSFRLLHAK